MAGFEASLTERKPPPTLLGVLITVRASWARPGVTTMVLVRAPGTDLQGAQGGHSPHNCSRVRALKENTRSSGLEEPGKGAQCRGQLEARTALGPLGAARG